jgi:hypothetical protein
VKIEAWQLSILVTTGVILAEFAVDFVLRRRDSLVLSKRVRTGALGALAMLTIAVGVVALGPSLADQLASVAAAVTAVVAVWLTYRSYHAMNGGDTGGTGAPAQRAGPDGQGNAGAGPERDDTTAAP